MQTNPEPLWIVTHKSSSRFLFEPKVSNKGTMCFHLQSALINVLANLAHHEEHLLARVLAHVLRHPLRNIIQAAGLPQRIP
uniref:Uncharacterized protein n=1 Tax=Arundo donax TaxID=35708 RepID=A0A0A9DS87_ARUDO